MRYGACLLTVAGVTSPAVLAAQGVRVSEIEPRPTGDVVDVRLSPDGAWCAYLADHRVAGTYELFAVPSDGSVNPRLVSAAPVLPDFVFGAGGARLVYSTASDLFSAPIDGLGPPMRLDFAAQGLLPTPDGARVVYSLYGTGAVRVCPVDQAQPVQILGEPSEAFSFTPDGSALVLRTDHQIIPDLVFSTYYHYPMSGGGARQLIGRGGYRADFQVSNRRIAFWGYPDVQIRCSDYAVGERVLGIGTDLRLTRDGARLLYLDGDRRLTSVATRIGAARPTGTGSAVRGRGLPVRLSGPGVQEFALTPDESSIVHRTEASGTGTLFLIASDGSGSPLQLSASGEDVSRMMLTSDGRHVLYVVGGALECVSLDPVGAPVVLAQPSVPGGDVGTLLASPASGRVVFTADHLQDGVFELFAAPLDGSAPAVRLNATLPPGASFEREPGKLLLAPDGASVVFSAEQDSPGVFELYRVDTFGAQPPQRLSGPRELGLFPRRVLDYQVPAHGSRIVYRANAEDETQAELYASVAGNIVKLSAHKFPGRGVVSYRLSTDGKRVVWGEGFGLALHDTPSSLFGVPTDGSLAPVRIATEGGVIWSYQLTPDGERVLYINGNPTEKLYSAPTLGGAPVLLSGNQSPFDYAISPDGSTVVFNTFSGLFACATDGSGVLRQLCPLPRVNFSDIEFVFTPDGTRVVFETQGPLEHNLFTAAVVGREVAARRLAPPSAIASGFAVTADGARVVFRADTGTGRTDLFSSALPGGAAPVLLSGALPLNRDVQAFALGADPTRVAYIADGLVNDQFELFVVPVDGSAAPVPLSRAPVSGGDVQRLSLTPDGTHVLYVGDLRVDRRDELFSVPLDGSAADVNLSGELPSFSDVGDFAPLGNGRVGYLRNTSAGARLELFSARIDGQGEPEQLSTPPVAGGGVLSFQSDASGARIYYLSTQEFTDGAELFQSLVRPPTAPAGAPAPGRTVTRSL